jgi:hypothetical protein
MSGESELHIRLVEKLIYEVRRRHSDGANIAIFAEHHSFGRNRPARIGGFFPDVFASDVPETFRVVGEAKTESDLKTNRSERQRSCAFSAWDWLTRCPMLRNCQHYPV